MLLAVSFVLALVAGLINYLSSGSGTYTWTFGYGHGQYQNYEYSWHFTLLNLVFASLILNLVSAHATNSFAGRLLENNWLVRIGRVSYGMYIFHWAILVYVFNRLVPDQSLLLKFVLFLPYLLVVYLIATVSYRFYESWFIGLKDRLFKDKHMTARKTKDAAFKAHP